MQVILLLLFAFCFIPLVKGDECNSLDGYWYNQLGSEILLRHGKDSRLTGEYRTAVERKTGAAGTNHSEILGAAPYNKPGAAFAFSVVWRNGFSTTVWVAQCMVCDDGHETLLTSWLLRSKVDTCIDKWKSTMIGRDTFTRYEQHGGPRKRNNTHVPIKPGSNLRLTRSTKHYGPRKPCEIEGPWYNGVGSEVIIGDKDSQGAFKGEYRTAVEREKGAAGHSHSSVYGISSPDYTPNNTFAFMVVWREGASVTGWVGQCHICGENHTEVLEATWLLRSKIESCGDNWKSTLYGENSYTRHEQKPGPRKRVGTHTPNRDGEDGSSTCKSCVNFPKLHVVFASFLLVLVQYDI